MLAQDFRTTSTGIKARTISSKPTGSGLRGGLCGSNQVLKTRISLQLPGRKVTYTQADRPRRD